MKKIIYISQLQPDMVLAQDILDTKKRLLVPLGCRLTDSLIEKIKRLTSYEKLLVFVEGGEFDLLVEKKGGEQVRVKSTEIFTNTSPRRVEVGKKLDNLEKSLEKTLDDLNLHPNSPQCQEEIDKTIGEIMNNIEINAELLEEIVEIKSVDDYLYRHSLNVALISYLIGYWLGLDKKQLKELSRAGLLHDVGKLRVDQEILNKPSKLTDEEFAEIKKHSEYSYRILKEMGVTNKNVLTAVTFHHEKQDGSGYPFGLIGDMIPLYARILTIADIFDAMTSERCYKARVSPFRVLEMFQNHTFGELDLKITMLFIEKFAEYYIGTYIMLNNGEKAKIVGLNNFEVNKPLVKLENGEFVDISKKRNVEIVDFLK